MMDEAAKLMVDTAMALRTPGDQCKARSGTSIT